MAQAFPQLSTALKPRYSRGQDSPRPRRRNFEVGNEEDEVEPGRNAKLLAIQTTSDIEPAKFGRGSVVGVTFQTGAEFEELRARQCSFWSAH